MGLLVIYFFCGCVGGLLMGWWLGVEFEFNAYSATNWVGVGAGAQLGNILKTD